MELLSKIRPHIEYKKFSVQHICDDNCDHIDPVLQLAITLRLLAGDYYLDICFGYNVSTGSIYAIFWHVLQAIDEVWTTSGLTMTAQKLWKTER